MSIYDELLNGYLITHEDITDFDATCDDSIRRSKSRLDLKRELTISIDEKRTKSRPTNKSNISRNIKSAPAIRRTKSQLVITTKRKEKNIDSSRPVPSANPVYLYIFVCLVFVIVYSVFFMLFY